MPPAITWETETDDGVTVELEIPARWEVCSTCNGAGSHVNPAIDGHGITQEERDRDWSPEEWEGYMRGAYDVTCYECDGRTTVLAADWQGLDKSDPALADRYRAHLDAELRYAIEDAAERRMGY